MSSSSRSAIASRAALLLPPEGHASIFFSSASSSSGQASTASLSPRGLPQEIFLHIMAYLHEHQLVRCSHVCSNWRKAIVGCNTLWTELEAVDVATFEALDRVRAVASRSKGALRTLSLCLEDHLDIGLDQLTPILLRQILREITVLDGARNLRHLELDLLSFRYQADEAPAYDCVFAEFSAVNLETLKILTALDRFPAGAPFLSALPSLKKLLVSSERLEPTAHSRLPDFFGAQPESPGTSGLTTLVLAGPSLRDPALPSFPHLRTLKLYDTPVDNLYELLTKCASTLETLWLRGVSADPPSKYLPLAPGATQKDTPPVLLLPRLTDVQICGEDAPLLWLKPTTSSSSFCTDTPVLRMVSFSEQHHFDAECADEIGEANIDAVVTLSGEALCNLFRNSPQLEAVNLTDTNVDPAMLIASLPFASAALTHINIGGTPAACDALIDRLHDLAPQLSWLGTYSDDCEGEMLVSVQALARFARATKQSLSPLRTSRTDWHLTIVAHRPFRYSSPSVSDLRATLRNHLATLSPSQLSHLTSSLTLNTPPTLPGIAATLAFSSLKSEIHSLASPPSPSPYLDPFPANPGEYTAVALKLKKWQAQHGAAAAAAAAKTVATPQMVVAAEDAMQAWVTRREQDAALAWCEEEEGVELLWGHGWCGITGAHCDCLDWGLWRGGEHDDK
ncbi:hypothetical protein JCM1840_004265 [Sporobolomyces johnsonii]